MTWNKAIDHKESNRVIKSETEHVPDGGWGWIVTCAACIGLILCASFVTSTGIIYSYIIEEFDFDLTPLTFIGSVHTVIAFSGGSYYNICI